MESVQMESVQMESSPKKLRKAPYKAPNVQRKAPSVQRKAPSKTLAPRYNAEFAGLEIGVDEAGRGPMLGRVYTAAVILPPEGALFDHSLMKDSKKFHSPKKIAEAAEYIKTHALHWSIEFSDEQTIDQVNIRNATLQAMHRAIKVVMQKANASANGTASANANADGMQFHLLIDGCDFKPVTHFDVVQNKLMEIPHTCIEGGDNLYSAIAAASILAKVARDAYVADLCAADPSLIERYDLLQNKGYGTAKHLAGIRAHGISKYHRQTFGLCKEFVAK